MPADTRTKYTWVIFFPYASFFLICQFFFPAQVPQVFFRTRDMNINFTAHQQCFGFFFRFEFSVGIFCCFACRMLVFNFTERLRITMCLYVHIYIYTYIHLYIYTSIHIYIYTHTHTYTHTYIYVCIYTYIHTYTYAHIHIHIYTNTHIHIYTCTHIHIY